MAKILKRTGAAYLINDTGQTVPANGQLTIDPANYAMYARSSDTISALASGDLVYNDGSQDLSLFEATSHLQDSFPSRVGIDELTPFAAKTIQVNGVTKSLFKRVHGTSKVIAAAPNAASSTTENIDFVIPYAHCKFTGAEIFGTNERDSLNFYIIDDANGTYSGGTPNAVLNQFGFDVRMPSDRYKNTSDYDADLYPGMIIRCEYSNRDLSQAIILMNVWLHEVV